MSATKYQDTSTPNNLKESGHRSVSEYSNQELSLKCVTMDSINYNIKDVRYVLRGPIAVRTVEIESEMSRGIEKPFKSVIRCNIGDGPAMGQTPITFYRQVLSLCANPELQSHFPSDVQAFVSRFLAICPGQSFGAYTESNGMQLIREDIARFIHARDNVPANVENIIMTIGATEGIMALTELLNCDVNDKRPGIMVPYPVYPLYSGIFTKCGIYEIPYYLDESDSWGLTMSELERSITAARKYCSPIAIVVINPGNPTGQVLTEKNIQDVAKFALEERLLILADEVYQDNIYVPTRQFHSFKKVTSEMGYPYDQLELISLHSASKGFMGECGTRGGYMEVINISEDVVRTFMTYLTLRACPSMIGQLAIDCMVRPPQPGDVSYEKYKWEKDQTIRQFAERAKVLTTGLNAIKGIHCNEVQGAMYAFPKLDLPKQFIGEAESVGQEADAFYAMKLLNETGICIVPGSGFGQLPGTYHFRTTILPPIDVLEDMLKRLSAFHNRLFAEYV